MTTLAEAKAAYQMAVERQSHLDEMLMHHLAQEGFPRDRAIETEQEFEQLCQLTESFLPDEFSVARHAYRHAADQLKACALEYIKENGATSKQIENFECAMELPYREQELIEIILKLPC